MLDIGVPAEAEGVSLVPLMAGAGDEREAGTGDVARAGSEDYPEAALREALPAGPGQVRRAGPEKIPPEIAYAEALLYGKEQKSLSAYPWKLIYSTVTDQAELYNLAQDPGELENLHGLGHTSEAVLYESLFRLIFSTSDTWYIEMAGGGDAHAYDIGIKATEKRGPAALSVHKLLDSDGNILSTDALGVTDIKPAGIEFRDLMVSDPLVLAFKTEKSRVTVEFDIRIDGEPAASHVYIGRSVMNPASMPFTVRSAAEGVEGRAGAEAMPGPPYCLIWMDRTSYGEEATVELDDETRRELRSLGYIQ